MDKAVNKYKKNSLGIDAWSPNELKGIPAVGKVAIAGAMQQSLRTLAWPHQQLISLNPCLGKPSGGCRTICKTPMLYRMVCRSDDKVKKWEVQNTQTYDAATPGSSALTAALLRNLRAEVAGWLGKFSGTILNDYQKFFDTLDIVELVKEAYANDFPLDQLTLALQQHLAPRVIQVNGFSSELIQVFRSILAGCKHSVALTRAYLMRNMLHTTTKHPETHTSLFVDDTTMQATANTLHEVLEKLVPTVSTWAEGVNKLKLTLSSKGCIVTSCPKLSKLLRKELLSYGLEYQVETGARDLGVTHTSGATRPIQISKSRFLKAKSRVKKINSLAKISRMSRKLFSGSAYSAASWGHQAAAFSEECILKLERQAASASGITEQGRCRCLALLVTYGLNGTPQARLIQERVFELGSTF